MEVFNMLSSDYLYLGLEIAAIVLLSYATVDFVLKLSFLAGHFLQIKLGRKIRVEPRKVILITGATSGLGLCLAKRMHRLGFTVIATYYSDQEPGYSELRDISLLEDSEPRIYLLPLDITSSESIEACHKRVQAVLADNQYKLHALVNNAGCCFDGPFEWSQRDCVRRVIDTNLIGVIMMSRQFINRIILDKGRIVNVSSGLEFVPMQTMSIYGATKAGVAYFSESIDRDLRPYGAASYCILPGNYVTATNICFTRLHGTQKSIGCLSQAEKSTYSESIYESLRFSEAVARYRLQTTGLHLNDIEQIYGLNFEEIGRLKSEALARCPANFVSDYDSSKDNFLKRFFDCVFGKLYYHFSGQTTPKGLEDIGILTAFEAALLLERAPTRIYMGTPFFTWLGGPIAEVTPPLAYRIASSLGYKSYVKSILSSVKKNFNYSNSNSNKGDPAQVICEV